MDRKLVSIQRIINVEPIEGADFIEKATVLGWNVVVKKGEFKVGDLAVFFEVDSFLPIRPEYEFLRKSSYKNPGLGKEGFRLRTCKLRGQISQGLLLPTLILNNYEKAKQDLNLFLGDTLCISEEGYDVTEILEVTKWEIPIPASMAGEIQGSFPIFIPKTDEMRIQSAPDVLEEIVNRECYITEKADGTSMTVFIKKPSDTEHSLFGVCSRNLELKENKNNVYWKMVDKYNLSDNLIRWSSINDNDDFAIQCEVVGPGIQKNHMDLKENEIRIFNLYNITKGKYDDYSKLKEFCEVNNLPMVKVLEEGVFNYNLDELLIKAEGQYDGGKNREGIVIRTIKEDYSSALKGRLSFKVLNNKFLLKDEE